METFWRLLEESIIVQSILTIGVWATIIGLTIAGRPVSEILSAGGYTILGFWFGSKTASAISAAAAKSANAVALASKPPC